MSGRPDHAAARWADDAEGGGGVGGAGGAEGGGGVEGSAAAPVTGVGSRKADAAVRGGRATDDEAAAEAGVVEGGADDGPIMADVAALTAQRDEYLESLQRLKADFDNYRKRVARLQEEQSARAEANLVGKLLAVLDNLDLAWAHLGPRHVNGQDDAAVSEEARAIAQARGQLLDVLGKEGLERVDAVGVPFDPTVHDAVAHTGVSGAGAGEGPGTGRDTLTVNGSGSAPAAVSVDQVLRAGYRWRGQVLRPAMVRVRG